MITEKGETLYTFEDVVTGMGLRDWFAGQALSALVYDYIKNRADLEQYHTWHEQRNMLATEAFKIADAIILARKK